MSEAELGAFTKSQFVASKQFTKFRDVLNVLLEDDKQYTIDEVKKLIEGFLKKEVK